MEHVLFNQIKGPDWQVIIGSLLQDIVNDLYSMNEEEAAKFIFERGPSERVTGLLRHGLGVEAHQIRSGIERRGQDRRKTEEDKT